MPNLYGTMRENTKTIKKGCGNFGRAEIVGKFSNRQAIKKIQNWERGKCDDVEIYGKMR